MNPYAPPQLNADLRVELSAARKRVSRPATALIIMSSIHAVFVTIHLVSLGFTFARATGPSIPVYPAALSLFHLVSLIVISIGAAKLGFLESFRWARVGAILACIPLITPLYCVGIPFGIWALYLLANPDIREAFPDGNSTE